MTPTPPTTTIRDITVRLRLEPGAVLRYAREHAEDASLRGVEHLRQTERERLEDALYDVGRARPGFSTTIRFQRMNRPWPPISG